MPSASHNPTVALPETRQLDVLAQLLERRDVSVVRCPMIAIRDAADAAPVLQWIERLIAAPPDLLVIYTGEGVRRLTGFADRAGLLDDFIAALGRTRILTRGPKPVRALRDLDISPKLEAIAPTTEGVMATLDDVDIAGRRIGVQLYGTDPNETLMAYLQRRKARVDSVAPYEYASQSDDAAVGELIAKMHGGEIGAIAFTSKAQVERLERVARRLDRSRELSSALERSIVAAVGPVVADELRRHGVRVDVVPDRNFFMKPLVTLLVERLHTQSGETG